MTRPVYVPKNKRQRFHGAFTGGYSAGFFNTVGSREGWIPKNSSNEESNKKIQSIEDFMDEHDHQEWGGPSQLQSQFSGKQNLSEASGSLKEASHLESLFGPTTATLSSEPQHTSIGSRLLELWGWKEASKSALVPQERYENPKDLVSSDDCLRGQQLLSARRIRRIHLQQERTHIPPPRLDASGLGYKPLVDAPEFQRDLERRKKRARERKREVYHVATVSIGKEGEQSSNNRCVTNQCDADEPLVSQETIQDFVGTRSVGGFALHDDEDDAYDDEAKPGQLDPDAYDTVIQDVADSDAEDDNNPTKMASASVSKAPQTNKMRGLEAVLSSWASSTGNNRKSNVTVTSDGRPPLPGFVLGSSMASTSSQRFRGPDVPTDYDVHPHEQEREEDPLVLQAMAKAEKVMTMLLRQQQPLPRAPSSAPRDAPLPGVREGMSSRFASSTHITTGTLEASTAVGLMSAQDYKAQTLTAKAETTLPVPMASFPNVIRTWHSFTPSLLLCKRFHVPAPTSTNVQRQDDASTVATTRSASFVQELAKKVQNNDQRIYSDSVPGNLITEASSRVSDQETTQSNQRLPMDVYRTVFNTVYSSDETDLDDIEEEGLKPANPKALVVARQRNLIVDPSDDENLASKRSCVDDEGKGSSDDSSSEASFRHRKRRKDSKKNRRKDEKKRNSKHHKRKKRKKNRKHER